MRTYFLVTIEYKHHGMTWKEDVCEVYDGDESQNVQELHHQVLHQVPIILV